MFLVTGTIPIGTTTIGKAYARWHVPRTLYDMIPGSFRKWRNESHIINSATQRTKETETLFSKCAARTASFSSHAAERKPRVASAEAVRRIEFRGNCITFVPCQIPESMLLAP